MAEDEFEQIAIKCVDEITSFNLLAIDTQEVLSDWNTRLRELMEECDKEYEEIATANQALIKSIKDEAFEQSQEVGKITHAVEEATEALHRLLAKATEQHTVLDEASSIFGTSLKDYFEKHKQRQTTQADAHQKLISSYEEHGTEIEQSTETIAGKITEFVAKVTEHGENATTQLEHIHEQIDHHGEQADQDYEELVQHLDETHENVKQKIGEHEETLQHACEEAGHALEEGVTKGLDLLMEAAEALGADFAEMKDKLEELGTSFQESADEVDEELQTASQGMGKSAGTLGSLHELLARFQ